MDCHEELSGSKSKTGERSMLGQAEALLPLWALCAWTPWNSVRSSVTMALPGLKQGAPESGTHALPIC